MKGPQREQKTKHPESARVQYHQGEVLFFINQKEEISPVTCHFHGRRPHCSLLDERTARFMATNPLHEYDMPLGILEEYSKSNQLGHRLKIMGIWVLVIPSAYYGVKKLINKLNKGRCILPDAHHSHFFKTSHEIDHSLTSFNDFLKEIFPLIRENTAHLKNILSDTDDNPDLIASSKDSCNDSLALIVDKYQKAHSDDCLHDCNHEHHHSEEEGNISNKVVLWASDFYQEIFKAPIELIKTPFQREKRNQLLQFAELEAVKSYHEKGLILTVGSGIFILSTQLIYELIESIVLPAGMHLFCHVGNAVILSVSTTGYILYFHTKNIKEISFLSRKRPCKGHFRNPLPALENTRSQSQEFFKI